MFNLGGGGQNRKICEEATQILLSWNLRGKIYFKIQQGFLSKQLNINDILIKMKLVFCIWVSW